MKYELVSDRFVTWKDAVKNFVETEEFDKISDFLREQKRSGIEICPETKNVFRAFQCCDYNNLKAVIILQDPYFSKVRGKIIADGLAMSCSITDYPQPSLQHFKNEIQRTVYNGLNTTDTYTNNDLLYLEEQGVMLINAALTCELNKATSHIKVWEQFTANLLTNISDQKEDIVFGLLGAYAHKLEKYIDSDKHLVLKASHPASAAYVGGKWDSKDIFNKINDYLKSKGKTEIIW